MTDVPDNELTRDFADHQSEAAFTQLVQRHIHLVHSVALRFTGNAEDACDVTQAVFVILARKAAGLRQRATLTGWLYETTRLTARQFLRTKARQFARDQEAHMQSHLNDPDTDTVWRQLAPQLEEAMSRLTEGERALLALRFFENKTGEETAALLGIHADAAHKRTARAVEKLRGWFTKRGVTLTATVLTAAISANSVQAAPPGLAATVTATAAKGTVISATLTTLVNTTMKIMTWLKMKFAVGVSIAALLAVGGCVGKVSVEHARAFEAAQKKLIAGSLVVVYARAETTHLPTMRLVDLEVWKGSAVASAIGITNGMELLNAWDGPPPDHVVVSFPARVSSTPTNPEMLAGEMKYPERVNYTNTAPISSSTASANHTVYPVRDGKVCGIWSIQQFKSKFGL
jgi:RNA polymerase sigma factor (sigma-70 family)